MDVEVDLPQAAAVEALEQLTDGAVVLLGAPGTGKSTLAASALAGWVRAGKTGRWLTEEAYLESRRPEGKPDPAVFAVELVVLDDLGAAPTTDWARAQVEALVCRRYDAMLGMVITTNLDREAIRARYGERVVSRLAQMAGRGGWCVLKGGDRRLGTIARSTRGGIGGGGGTCNSETE